MTARVGLAVVTNSTVTPTQVGAYASLSELDVAISTSVHCERCDVSAWLHMS